MMRLLFSLLFTFPLVASESIYITDQTSGGDTGVDAANAHSIAWFNTSGNWDTDNSADGLIGPGDTVYFSGTITNQATLQGNGTSTDWITLRLLSGCKFTKPAWTSTGAITATSKSYFYVYGGNTNNNLGTNKWLQVDIENTANTNGSPVYTAGSRAMYFASCSNITLRSLLITNMYQRVEASTNDLGTSGSAISFQSSGCNIIVENCAIFRCSTAINIGGGNASWPYVTNLWIRSNFVYQASTSLQMGMVSGSVIGDSGFTWNRLDGFTYWSGIPDPNQHHSDGIQTITPGGSDSATTYITNLTVAYNHIGPQTGLDSFNGFIFLEDYITGGKVHHNLLRLQTNGVASNGFIPAGVHSTIITNFNGARMLVAYNTIKGSGGATAISTQYADVMGNVIYDTGGAISVSDANHNALALPTGRTGITSNSNLMYSTAQDSGAFGLVWDLGGSAYTPTRWTNCPYTLPGVGDGPYLCLDTASLFNTDPLMNDDGTLRAGSPALAYGPNLTSLGITSDINGNARPSSGNWTLGAFEGTNSASSSTRVAFSFGSGVKLIGPGSVRQ